MGLPGLYYLLDSIEHFKSVWRVEHLHSEEIFSCELYFNRISNKVKVENGSVQDTNVPTYMILNVWHITKVHMVC